VIEDTDRAGRGAVLSEQAHPDERGDRAPFTLTDQDGHVRSLLPGYALGVLDPEEMELVARHVQSCPFCLEELGAYEETAGMLAYGAPVQPVPLRARAALLARVDEIGTDNAEQLIVLPPAPRDPWFISRRIARFSAFSAAPAAVIAIMIMAMILMGERISEQQQQIDQIEDQKKAAQAELMRVPTPANPRFMTDLIRSSAAPNASGKMFINHDANTALLLAVDLPTPDASQHYVVWLEIAGTNEYARYGTLEVDSSNRAQLEIHPIGPLAQYDAVAITVESEPEPATPTGPQLMTAGLVAP
jgi:hypothetical protein